MNPADLWSFVASEIRYWRSSIIVGLAISSATILMVLDSLTQLDTNPPFPSNVAHFFVSGPGAVLLVALGIFVVATAGDAWCSLALGSISIVSCLAARWIRFDAPNPLHVALRLFVPTPPWTLVSAVSRLEHAEEYKDLELRDRVFAKRNLVRYVLLNAGRIVDESGGQAALRLVSELRLRAGLFGWPFVLFVEVRSFLSPDLAGLSLCLTLAMIVVTIFQAAMVYVAASRLYGAAFQATLPGSQLAVIARSAMHASRSRQALNSAEDRI